jgi:hypothetical protein
MIPAEYFYDPDENEAVTTEYVFVRQGAVDVSVPADLDDFERGLVQLAHMLNESDAQLLERKLYYVVLRFLELPGFTGRTPLLELRNNWGTKEVTFLALRDRSQWEIIAPTSRWAMRTLRSRNAMNQFLRFHPSVEAMVCQLDAISDFAGLAKFLDSDDLALATDEYDLFTQDLDPRDSDDPIVESIEKIKEEAFTAMYQELELTRAVRTMRSLPAGSFQRASRPTLVNENGILVPKFGELTQSEQRVRVTATVAARLAAEIFDDIELRFLPVAPGHYEFDGPVIEVRFSDSLVMVLRLDESWHWYVEKGSHALIVEHVWSYESPLAFSESPSALVVLIFMAHGPDFDGNNELAGLWKDQQPHRRILEWLNNREASETPSSSDLRSALHLMALLDEANDRWIDSQLVDDECVGAGDCPAGCLYCDDYKDRHRAGECGGDCFLC